MEQSRPVEKLQKAVAPTLSQRLSSRTLELFRDSEFWIWDAKIHKAVYEATQGQCCFNHIVGLPRKEHAIGRRPKDGTLIIETHTHPLYDYQKPILDSILNYEPTASIKATGMGVTTMTLRLMCWLALRNDDYVGDTFGIVTGPRIDIAKEEIGRIPHIFQNVDFSPKVVGTSITINNCEIIAYPSHTFDAARGLERVRFFFADESDFFPPGQQIKARHVIERYRAKSHPFVLLNSTPNEPGGMMDTIERETKSIYTIHRLPYTLGVGKIYTPFEIEEAKLSPSFQREYNLQYGVGVGNIFNGELLNRCVAEYPLESQGGFKVLSLDPAYGESETASTFGICGVEKRSDGKFYIVKAEQRARSSGEVMLEYVGNFYRPEGYQVCQVDGAYPEVIADLQRGNPTTNRQIINAQPIVFGKVLSDMTTWAVRQLNEDNIRIHPAFTELIGQMHAVEYNEKGHPDKKKLRIDVLDALIMSLFYWRNKTAAKKLKGEF